MKDIFKFKFFSLNQKEVLGSFQEEVNETYESKDEKTTEENPDKLPTPKFGVEVKGKVLF